MLASRIKCTTATTGTGALTLASTGVRDSVNGDALAPAEDLADLANRRVSYYIVSGNNWAEGDGSLSADGLTLTRDANEKNWNGSALALGLLSCAGTSTIIISPRASEFGAGRRGRALSLPRAMA